MKPLTVRLGQIFELPPCSTYQLQLKYESDQMIFFPSRYVQKSNDVSEKNAFNLGKSMVHLRPRDVLWAKAKMSRRKSMKSCEILVMFLVWYYLHFQDYGWIPIPKKRIYTCYMLYYLKWNLMDSCSFIIVK